MTEPTIDWQTEPETVQKILVGSTKFERISELKTTRYPSGWKQNRIKSIKKIRKETDFKLAKMTVEDDFLGSARAIDTGVAVEPYLIPDELVRFFREKPLIPFISSEEESKKSFEEASYQWAKKKMSGSKPQ